MRTPVPGEPELVADLRALTRDGGDGNHLVVTRGQAWFIVRGVRGGTTLDVESAASFYLPRSASLDPGSVHVLRKAGYVRRAGLRNLVRTVQLAAESEATLAASLADLLVDAYRQPAEAPIQRTLVLGARDATRNDALVDAMRTLSKERSEKARNRVYSHLLRARLLVPLDGGGNMETFGEITGMPVFGVFSDLAALQAWSPRGHAYEVVGGAELFPALMATKVGSLLINPQGNVGGELYRNEIEAIAAVATARWAGKR